MAQLTPTIRDARNKRIWEELESLNGGEDVLLVFSDGNADYGMAGAIETVKGRPGRWIREYGSPTTYKLPSPGVDLEPTDYADLVSILVVRRPSRFGEARR